MLNILLTIVVNGHNYVRQRNATCMLRSSTYDDAMCVCVNAAVEINMLDYNVAVRQRSLTHQRTPLRVQRAGRRGGRTDIPVA